MRDVNILFLPTMDFFLPSMKVAESGQSGMHAQQPHGKMLSLVDVTCKDISKQMCQDARFKAAARNQPVDMVKSLNLLDLQLYARSEQEKHAPILAQNLAEGNQWLEESALENNATREHNFFPHENSSHKFIDVEEEENSIQKDNPNEQHNPSQQKSNTKRPLEGTGKGNAKKSKTFHPPEEEPSTSGIEIKFIDTCCSRQRQCTGKKR